MRRLHTILTLAAVLLFGACVSTAPGGGPPPPSSTGFRGDTRTEEMKKLLDSGRAAMDSNHLAEGIRSFVAVLSMAKDVGSVESGRLGADAEAELVRIGTRLSLEPGEAWVGPNGSQVAGSVRSIGKDGSLQPTVFLFENWGNGKSPVPDASIRFEFLRGSGVLTASADTDLYGRANAILSRMDSSSSEAVIRAYPAFTVKGYTYAFRAASRDFSYLSPTNVTKVVALERGSEGASSNPQILDTLASILMDAGLEASPLDGKLLGDGFDKAFGGDPTAVHSLSSASGASYLAFILSEASAPRQMEYGGKKYNIFTSDCKTTLRILRDDGTIVFSLPLENARGQGGTARGATADSFSKAREALTLELNKRVEEIRKALRN